MYVLGMCKYIYFSVHRKESARPYIYNVSLLLLPPNGELAKLGPTPDIAEADLLQSMWKLGRHFIMIHILLRNI